VSSQRLSICGCGWLGLPLASHFVSKGFKVKGSSRSTETLTIIRKLGINPYLIDTKHPEEWDSDFFNCDTLILTLPFKRSFEDPYEYLSQIKTILRSVSKKTRLIFTSSTSIYPNQSGYYKESSPLGIETPRQKALLEVENTILNHHPSSTVARLSGLWGPERDIGKFKIKKKLHPNSTTNLIHQDDAVNIISQLVIDQHHGTFNIVSNQHPTREELYGAKACTVAAPLIKKIVSNKKITETLSYTDFKEAV